MKADFYERFFNRVVPDFMREPLKVVGGDDPIWSADQFMKWAEACKDGRADIEAFFQPMEGSKVLAHEHVRQRAMKELDGTPTASDLESQVAVPQSENPDLKPEVSPGDSIPEMGSQGLVSLTSLGWRRCKLISFDPVTKGGPYIEVRINSTRVEKWVHHSRVIPLSDG